jgi:hypothetical protein
MTSLIVRVRHLVAVLCLICLSFGAAAGSDPQGSPDRFAVLKEIAARNQAALRQYTWIQTTQISDNGEVKATKVESCGYGPDGQLRRTVISAPQVNKEPGLRGIIQEHKEAEIKNQLESANVLVHSYVPPTADKLQAAVAAGSMQMLTAPSDQAILVFANYQLPGDALTLTFNLEPRSIATVDVATWLGAPTTPVTLAVQFQVLPDGTNYWAVATLAIPSSRIQVVVNNSDYRRVLL